jgi:hypothetical protein
MPLIFNNVTFGSGITFTGPPALTFTTPANLGTTLLNSVTFNPATGTLVAVGASTTQLPHFTVSTNGGTVWSTPAAMNGSAVASTQRCVTCNPNTGVFVSVGGQSLPQFAVSTNGTTWTTPAAMNGTATPTVMYGVTYSSTLNIFVAVGYSGTTSYYATSTDGTTWITPTAIPGTGTLRSVVWSSALGLFVAVGSLSAGTAIYATSTDGSTWSTIAVCGSATTVYLQQVAVSSSGRFVAVGYTGLSTSFYTTSTDGTTWTTPVNVGIASGSMLGITWANNLFVMVGYASGTQGPIFSTSADGTTWTAPAAMNGSTSRANMFSVVAFGSQFVTVGTLGTTSSGAAIGT